METDALRSRREFEYRLGHFLAAHPSAIRISQEMCSACLRFLRARTRALRKTPSGREHAFYASLAQVLRPIALPFAGRPRNARELLGVLNGEGNLRELQGVVWLVISHVLIEDAVGPKAVPHCLDTVSEAGLYAEELRRWVTRALEHRATMRGPAAITELNPHEDVFRMPWHAARRAQNETRVYFSDFHLKWRYWSLVTRREFELEGGTFSRIERQLRSVLGPDLCPWFDVRRFTRPNETSALVRFARALDIPLENGVSGVAVQSLQFARTLGIADIDAVRIAVCGYLMSLKAHSFYEVTHAMQEDESLPIVPLDYRDSLKVDWRDAARHCGPIPFIDIGTSTRAAYRAAR